MFNPFGALTATARGAVKGYTEDAPLIFEQMGMEALGRAFQPDQGPQPPMPGQPSMRAAPPQPQGPMRVSTDGQPVGGGPPMGAPPPPQSPQEGGIFGGMGRPMSMGEPPAQPSPGGPPPGGGAPPPAAGPPPSAAGGMPQLDLQTLAQRIMAKNPNLPPQAMMAALNRAEPLLSAQGKLELSRLAVQQRERGLNESERHHRVVEGQRGAAAGQPGGLMSEDAIDAAAERYIKTGQMPPNLGRGVQGRADMAAIQNRAAEVAKERGIKPEDLTKNWQTFKAEQVAIQRFMSGPQGNTVRSLGVVVDHLGTMRELAMALQNNDIQAVNRIANAWAEQTGQPAPTNAATAAQIVGAEVIKSLGIAGAGTKEERQEAANAFARAKSPQQLVEAIDKVVKPLMLGQLKGLRRQFKVSTGLAEGKFDDMLGDEAKEFFSGGGKGGGGKGAPEPGTVQDGYRFKGGDPAKQENWEKVK